jgi:hypothetical protein
MMREGMSKLRFLVTRGKPAELDEELQFHLAQSIDAKVAAGMDAEEARRQALVEFGGRGSSVTNKGPAGGWAPWSRICATRCAVSGATWHLPSR